MSARAFPDVADYPGHSSCVRCHRSDFFQGNNPAICTICHTASSPRNGTRFPFPVRSRSSEFTTIFPHDAHQDIIARNEGPARRRLRPGALFCAAHAQLWAGWRKIHSALCLRAGYRHRASGGRSAAAIQQLRYLSPDALGAAEIRQPAADARPGTRRRDAVDSFAPGAGFFKSSPRGPCVLF